MAGIFKNMSNSGGAIFKNISNSGRGLFYGDGYIPPPPSETTTTTTTTTTSTTTTTTTNLEPTTTTTTTTTQAPPVTFTLSYSNIDGATACSNYPTVNTDPYYAAPGSTLSNDTTIYSNYNDTLAPNGYYSNGVDYWIVAASAGVLNSQTSCTPTTTTTTTSTTTTTTTQDQVRIDWTVSEEGSGAVQLIIKNSANIEVVNQQSEGVTPINGTVYINQSQTPYTVVVSVASGAEVAQYRICDNTNLTEIVYNNNVPVTSTYVVNPTPLWSTVYATYGNTNTPVSCPV
jgi:hypothetical protein